MAQPSGAFRLSSSLRSAPVGAASPPTAAGVAGILGAAAAHGRTGPRSAAAALARLAVHADFPAAAVSLTTTRASGCLGLIARAATALAVPADRVLAGVPWSRRACQGARRALEGLTSHGDPGVRVYALGAVAEADPMRPPPPAYRHHMRGVRPRGIHALQALRLDSDPVARREVQRLADAVRPEPVAARRVLWAWLAEELDPDVTHQLVGALLRQPGRRLGVTHVRALQCAQRRFWDDRCLWDDLLMLLGSDVAGPHAVALRTALLRDVLCLDTPGSAAWDVVWRRHAPDPSDGFVPTRDGPAHANRVASVLETLSGGVPRAVAVPLWWDALEHPSLSVQAIGARNIIHALGRDPTGPTFRATMALLPGAVTVDGLTDRLAAAQARLAGRDHVVSWVWYAPGHGHSSYRATLMRDLRAQAHLLPTYVLAFTDVAARTDLARRRAGDWTRSPADRPFREALLVETLDAFFGAADALTDAQVGALTHTLLLPGGHSLPFRRVHLGLLLASEERVLRETALLRMSNA
jgi:hypothetical protein